MRGSTLRQALRRTLRQAQGPLRDRPLRDGLQEQTVEAIIKRSRLH